MYFLNLFERKINVLMVYNILSRLYKFHASLSLHLIICPRLHPGNKGSALVLPEVLVRIVQVHSDAL